MKNKTLNQLILALLACFASLGLTTLSILLKNNDLVHLDLIMLLLSTITDVLCLISVYFAVKSAFTHKSDLSIWVAGISTFMFIILWTVFKNYVFKGVFDIVLAFDYLYLSLFTHFFNEIINSIVVYFGVTLFAATDVINQMMIFTLKVLTMMI